MPLSRGRDGKAGPEKDAEVRRPALSLSNSSD
jgi:hypothetical protein